MIWSLNDELDELVARPPSGSRHLCSKRGGGDDRGEGEGMQEGADNQNSVTFWTNPTYGEVPPPLPALLLFHPTRQIPTPWGQQLTPKDITPVVFVTKINTAHFLHLLKSHKIALDAFELLYVASRSGRESFEIKLQIFILHRGNWVMNHCLDLSPGRCSQRGSSC
ncbi:hypothetical protein MJO28_012557 [Puccinia striiformis f. sp. tritici]|uniref:Uncharacterized protein n=1 Tax=Puccinia striiformis f. sp. tritici TaxID=168172 RepID=A0ACC0E2E3_9BASI|nr:hypothetical protein MJO28_012557 [Puccinia striiformis f. sp. tritici]